MTAGMLLSALRNELNKFSGDVPLEVMICGDASRSCTGEVVEVSLVGNMIQIVVKEASE